MGNKLCLYLVVVLSAYPENLEISFVPLSLGFDWGYLTAVFLIWTLWDSKYWSHCRCRHSLASTPGNKFCKCLNKGINGQWQGQFQVNHTIYRAGVQI